jgi:hypothetical protein
MKFRTFETFTKNNPIEGYYWYVDTSYPIPNIGFYQACNRLFFNNRMQDHTQFVQHYRIGDMIAQPDIKDMEIE